MPLLAPVLLANAAPQDGSDPFPAPDLPLAIPVNPGELPELVIPPEIPPQIEAMVNAAIKSGNDAEVDTVAKYARATTPDSAGAINRLINKWRTGKRLAHEKVVEQAGVFDLWTGKAQVGGWLTTGNSRNLGLSGAVDLDREGLKWRHKLHLQADYQRSFGITTREHYLASYEPNYKVDDRSYIYGSAQYESDRFLGYINRYSASFGAGYSAIKNADLKLDLELGPAYRATNSTDNSSENSIATRGSVDFNWKLSQAISVSQEASAYLQQYNSTVTGTTALNAKLIGPLSAQLSYNFQYESEPPVGSMTTDTTSRAALVYQF